MTPKQKGEKLSSTCKETTRNEVPLYRVKEDNLNTEKKAYECMFCMIKHLKVRVYYPAWDQPCLECGKENHFRGSKACRGKRKPNS